jgi:hypothetical protein
VEVFCNDSSTESCVCILKGFVQLIDCLPTTSFNTIVPNIEIALHQAGHSDGDGRDSISKIVCQGYIALMEENMDMKAVVDDELQLGELSEEGYHEEKDATNDEIQTQPSFESLCDRLRDSSLSPAKIEYIISSLSRSNMTSLVVNGNETPGRFRLDDEDIRIVAQTLLLSNIPLESLTLRFNRITDIGMKFIGQYLFQQRRTNEAVVQRVMSITYLDVEGNDITTLESLKIHTSKVNNLKYLNISSNPLGEMGGLQLASSLSTNRRLRTLIANNCGFTLNVMIGIFTSLYGNKTLEEIEFDRSLLLSKTIDQELCDHLSRLLLERSTALSYISLRWSNITDVGIKLLVASLAKKRTVRSLNFESNAINASGAEALASCIILQQRHKEKELASPIGLEKINQTKNSIEVLKLAYNHISDYGAMAVAEAIATSQSLKKVTLRNNSIGPKGLIAVGEALKQTSSLQSITVFGNDFDQASGELYYHLVREVLPALGISIDIDVYVVDGIYMIAEIK